MRYSSLNVQCSCLNITYHITYVLVSCYWHNNKILMKTQRKFKLELFKEAVCCSLITTTTQKISRADSKSENYFSISLFISNACWSANNLIREWLVARSALYYVINKINVFWFIFLRWLWYFVLSIDVS